MTKVKVCQSCYIPLAPQSKVCKYCTPTQEDELPEDDISQEIESLLKPTGVTPKVLYTEE